MHKAVLLFLFQSEPDTLDQQHLVSHRPQLWLAEGGGVKCSHWREQQILVDKDRRAFILRQEGSAFTTDLLDVSFTKGYFPGEEEVPSKEQVVAHQHQIPLLHQESEQGHFRRGVWEKLWSLQTAGKVPYARVSERSLPLSLLKRGCDENGH